MDLIPFFSRDVETNEFNLGNRKSKHIKLYLRLVRENSI